MVAALFVFRFVVDHRIFNFNFTGRKVTLEIFHVGSGIPQTPFDKREDFQLFNFLRIIF